MSSRAVTLLDHFRIPYELAPELELDGIASVRSRGGEAALLWPVRFEEEAVAATVLGADGTTEVPVFARVLGDGAVEPLLAACGGGWRRIRAVRGPGGEPRGSIWRREDGSVFLPFDPDEAILNYWSERYREIDSGRRVRVVRRVLMAGYYQLRPLIPRAVQIWLRRRFVRVQAHSAFPRWPVETCLHDLFDLMLALLREVLGEPLPSIAPWPDGHSWALVLTHDVEHERGWKELGRVVEMERGHGVRSSWNLVPRRTYEVTLERVRELTDQGFEVGVHGLHHDGRDLASLAVWRERLPAIREFARRWGAVGFASPAMHRHWEWMPLVGLEYDRSYPDTDPFEPQGGGCCTWLPFFNDGLVELPATLAQDHTLFVILRHDDGAAWAEKARFLRERGGMALIVTHPDYLVDERISAAYEGFLAEFAHDPTAWKALPREVGAWWRRRAASIPRRDGDGWTVAGPAQGQARVELLDRRLVPEQEIAGRPSGLPGERGRGAGQSRGLPGERDVGAGQSNGLPEERDRGAGRPSRRASSRERVAMLLENDPYPQDGRVRAEAESLVAAGHAVEVVAPRSPGQLARERVNGVDVRRFRTIAPEGPGIAAILLEYAVAMLALHVAAVRALLRGATVLHIHNPPDTCFPAGALFRVAGRKVVFDHHDLAPELVAVKYGSGVFVRLARIAERLTFAVASHVLAANESHAAIALGRGHKRAGQVSVVRNGPPETWTSLPLRVRPGRLSPIRLAYLGQLAHQDGVDGIAQILSCLRARARAINVALTVIGDGEGRGPLESALERAGVADRVTITGWVDWRRIPDLLQEADACVDPAPSTPLNERSTMVKIAEYLSLGKPVVAYDLRETRRTVGDAGMLAPAGDVQAFAERIATLAEDPELRHDLAHRARARARELTWDRSEAALLAAYAGFAAGGR